MTQPGASDTDRRDARSGPDDAVAGGHGQLAVVIPCFNEALTIKTVLDRVLASPFTAEVVVVDDGSTDDSADIVRGVGDDRVHLIEQGLNLGKGSALRRGFVEVTAPYVLVQDADLEYDPDQYAALLGPIVSGQADVVIGSRFAPQPHRVLFFRHSLANKGLTLVSNALTNLNLTDVMSGAKAFRREVLDSIEIEQDHFGVEPELVAKVAESGWRVFEVGISYEARSYDEGKKASWPDGFKALLAVLRYSKAGVRLARPRARHEQRRADFESADNELADSLDSLDDAGNYADWIVELIAPNLGDRIIEIGAGHGTMSSRLRRHAEVTASELSPRAAAVLETRFADDPGLTVVEGDVEAAMATGPYDSAVMINVLEHIPDDIGALRAIYDGLRPGGTIAVYVPAHEFLYSNFDRKIGHCRRYRRSTLAQAYNRIGFELVSIRYLSLPGAIAWLVVARLLRGQPTNPRIARTYDRLVIPILRRIEARWPAPAGQSLLAIGRRPLDG